MLSDVLMKILEGGNFPEQLMPYIGGASPLLMLKANAKLSLEVDEDMKNAISTNPLVEPVLMDANTLV